jgi:glycosyltransferase involved in cell wall biosynthesis
MEPVLRVVICWVGMSGYLVACWRALALRAGIDLRLVVFPTVGTVNAPFRADLVDGLAGDFLDEKYLGDTEHVAALVAAHQPEVVIIAGWAIPAFNGLISHPKLAAAKFGMAMDTPWKGTLRQRLAPFKLAKFVRRCDRVIVPGERSWQYARRLGFSEAKIRRGMYGIAFSQFRPLLERRMSRPGGWPRRFLFVGRYVQVKGIDVLLEGYARYRRQVSDPWGLTCCGTGPLQNQIAQAEGVVDRGFIQPPDQPEVFAEHGAFVIASTYEPWGAAIAEGMAAGMPAICTESCGAVVELVSPYWNGISVATGDPDALANAMRWMHEHEAELPEMGRRARESAEGFSAEAWANRWEQMCIELNAGSASG